MKRTLLLMGSIGLFSIVGTAQAAADIRAGKATAEGRRCPGCHEERAGIAPNLVLAGKSEAKILRALKDYKSGKRTDPVMKKYADELSKQDMANVAAYYASLKVK